MRLDHFPLLAVSLVVLIACQRGDAPVPDPGPIAPLTGTPIALTRFGTDSTAFALYSGVREPANPMIRDAAAWSELWQSIHATMVPVPPLPEVDFDREMIVAAALGTRNTGGYNVLLAEAAEEEGSVQIQVIETSPGVDCVTTQALTQPIDLARMVRRDGAVRFLVTQQVRRCGP